MSSRASTTAATPALSSPITYEAQPRSSWVIWRKSISALRSLTLARSPPTSSTEPSRRWIRAAVTGASDESSVPALRLSGATSISALSCSMPRTTASATCSGVRVPTPRGSRHAGLGEHAGAGDEAGEDHRHPHAAAVQVLAQTGGEAAQPELGRRVERGADRGDLARQRRHEHQVPPAALDHAGQQRPRQLDRRAQVHVERAVDLLAARSRRSARWRAARRWPPARPPPRPARAVPPRRRRW